jgi:dTDP-4-dehydrorhamnose 3,5-epimerase
VINGVETVLPGMKLDDRGFFCVLEETLTHRRIIARSYKAGTLRGLHFRPGDGEDKLVRCSAGRIYDVIVDLRPGSSSYRQWAGFYLSGSSQVAVHVPAGCAHGYVTLEDNTDVTYRIDASYDPDAEFAFRWDDPELNIEWPIPPAVMSERDRDALSLSQMELLCRV